MTEKMGFEKRRTPLMSYGRTGYVNVAGHEYYHASDAERRWLVHMEPMLVHKKVNLTWQPKPFPLKYKYQGNECQYVYQPDALLVWNDTGEEWVIEIKNGAIHQKAKTKMIRFGQQYPEKRLVLVWFGSLPRKGRVVHDRLKAIEPHLDHIWRMK